MLKKLFKREIDGYQPNDVLDVSNPPSKLKFRIKEHIDIYGDIETYQYFPQMDKKTLDKDYNVDYYSCDGDWLYVSKSSIASLEEAKEFCSTVKPYLVKKESKYYDL